MPTKSPPAVNELKDILRDVNEWLRFAESKNATLLTLSTGAAIACRTIGEGTCSWGVFVFRHAFVVCMLLTALCCLVSFFPRLSESAFLSRRRGKVQRLNPLYFGSIASVTAEEYSRHIREIVNNGEGLSSLDQAYVDQIKANSTIASGKFRCFSIASRIAAAGLVALALLLLLTMH